MRLETLTLSIPLCPACGKAHHLPLVFLEQGGGRYEAQCTNNLQPVYGIISETGRLEVDILIDTQWTEIEHENILDIMVQHIGISQNLMDSPGADLMFQGRAGCLDGRLKSRCAMGWVKRINTI